jgi:lipopolysaccharide export system permease protein
MAKRYLLKLYLKYFFSILFALILFFVGLDFLHAVKSLSDSANLKVLYILYKSFYAIDILLPITLIFAMIALKVELIRSNELVAFYSVGVDKKDIIRPLFFTSVVITIFYILLHTTSFAYADEYAKNIRKFHTLFNVTKNLFFKFNDSYVFFEELMPLRKLAKGIKIYQLKEDNLDYIVKANEATFKNGAWHIKNAMLIKNLPEKIVIEKKDITTLVGYKPKILDSVYEGKANITLVDALYALKLFLKQNIDTAKLKSVIYANIFYPFFAPLLLVIIFYFVPVSARVANLNLFVFFAILLSLILWGMLFIFIKLSFNGALASEYAILLPIALLALLAFVFYKKF